MFSSVGCGTIRSKQKCRGYCLSSHHIWATSRQILQVQYMYFLLLSLDRNLEGKRYRKTVETTEKNHRLKPCWKKRKQQLVLTSCNHGDDPSAEHERVSQQKV